MYFTFILFVFSYTGFYIVEEFYLLSAFIGILLVVAVFFLSIIPLTDIIATRLARYTEERGVHKKGGFKLVPVFMVILPIALITFSIINEYGEKNLTKALDYEPDNVEMVEFQGISGMWQNESEEAAAVLYDFIGQYSVKKISYWDNDDSREEGFILTLYTGNDIIMATIYENRMLLHSDGNYYSVVNGPIDMDWVAAYNEKFN